MASNTPGASFNWDSTVKTADDSGDFTLLVPGYASFKVTGFEKGYFEGSERMAACNQANLTLLATDTQGNVSNVFVRLPLNTSFLWKITSFFKCCRLIPEETPANTDVVLPWGDVLGAEGICKVKTRTYVKRGETEERATNDVERFLHGDALMEGAAALGMVGAQAAPGANPYASQLMGEAPTQQVPAPAELPWS